MRGSQKDCAVPHIPVTPISRIEFRFNMSKNPSSQNDFMLATQFPLKIAFACTAHKIQGTTVPQPDPLIIDLKSVKEPAQAYVMMSRVQSLRQLFIINEIPRQKIYPSMAAMRELNRIQSMALNQREHASAAKTLTFSLNIRSLAKNHCHLLRTYPKGAGLLALQETWCHNDQDPTQFAIPGYNLHLVSHGRGKGIATYYKEEFEVTGVKSRLTYQMCKVSKADFDVINIYRSQDANTVDFLNDLKDLIDNDESRPCIILGDFNWNYPQRQGNCAINLIESWSFHQIIKASTHIGGGLLDHIYIKNFPSLPEALITYPYFSDHAAISIVPL